MNSEQDQDNRNVPPAKASNAWNNQQGTVSARSKWMNGGMSRAVHRILGVTEDGGVKCFLLQSL